MMSEQDMDTTTASEAPVETGEVEGTGPTELREAYNRTKQENRALRNEVLGIRLNTIGLDPSTGLGKAIAKEYSSDDLTAEAIAEYARTEYGHEGQVAAPSPQVEAAERMGRVQAVGEPIQPDIPSNDAQLEALRQRAQQGDVQASIALKLAGRQN